MRKRAENEVRKRERDGVKEREERGMNSEGKKKWIATAVTLMPQYTLARTCAAVHACR